MATEANNPAATGGTVSLTQEQLTAAIAAALPTVLKPLQDKLGELERNQGVLADTMKTLPPAAPAARADGKEKGEPLTAEAVSKMVADSIAADRKAQADAQAKTDAVKTAKAKVVADKLGGDAELARFLPDTADESQLAAAAEQLAVKVAPPVKAPGTRADGGTPTARQPVDTSKLNASQKVQLGVDQMLAAAQA